MLETVVGGKDDCRIALHRRRDLFRTSIIIYLGESTARHIA